jgi:hypothetical protein
VFVTVGHGVIVLAVGRKPLYHSLKVLFTEVAPGVHDLDVLEDIFFVAKFPGDVLLIVVEDYTDLLLLGFGVT